MEATDLVFVKCLLQLRLLGSHYIRGGFYTLPEELAKSFVSLGTAKVHRLPGRFGS